jgi:predicted nucleotidyltransferase
MAALTLDYDWSVTQEKVKEAVRRIVEKADPLQVIVFGSRARGDYRPDSDLDLAVILDVPEEEVDRRLSYSVLAGLHMSVDLIVVSKAKYDLHRPWLNSVFNYIDQEGVILYDREFPESARPDIVLAGRGRRVGATVSAA